MLLAPLAALQLAALAAAPPAALHLGGAPVRARLEVVATPAAPSPAFTWRSEGAERVGVAEDARLRATVRVAPAGPGAFELRLTVAWRVAAEVEREAVRLVLPGPARALGRDLELAPLRGPLRVDRGTPIAALTPALALVGGPGLAAARYTPAGRELEVDLVLDDAGAHPFAVYPSCLPSLPGLAEGAPIDFGRLEHKTFLGRTHRRAGETVEARATLFALAPGAPAHPLVPERWPSGAQAAVVFTDHADRTDPAALRAVLYGSSAAPGPVPVRGGFIGHGVRLTKSFFVRARRGGLETDPEARALAEALRAAGSEVASHSITGGPDDRAAVQGGLAALRALGVVTWIDHEPYTNCEAISSEGWRADGRYGIRDLLAGAGFRWVWEAGDLGGFRRAEVVDLFSARPPREPAPPIYPLPVDPRLWVFESSMFYAPPAELGAALSDAALDRLEARRGLFVAHTYLSASARTTTRPEHLARLAVRPGPGGALVIDPALDAALGRLGARARAGRLASLTWAEAGDRLRALGDLHVAYLPDGAARVENRGQGPLLGLTLAAPAEVELAVEGAEVIGRSVGPGRARVWLDLAPGASATVRARRGGAPAPFLPVDAGARLTP
ncbi:hypothetical protein [Anaeromyxobacter diazotrophicus]|uniref:Polysaccharide deacetylase n=1 Tax=Anaeromyxobacter diazotrophicus TaxID=2590199 RepID=A0A7I9VHI4_9BACT|nr:hypothetical protein [Anaeromyxobacter diazotrophicus]GEJ55862.1 hypothetical protein AMYX_06030 [Anaeromyxobacter diazotrophicus]